jgi:hypothetical protein
LVDDAKGAEYRAERKRSLVKALREQMEMKSRYRPPDDVIDENIKIFPMRDPLAEQKVKREKNRKLREDLERQLLESRRALEKRREEEKLLDEMTCIINNRPEVSGIDQQRNREARHRETLAFMENLRVRQQDKVWQSAKHCLLDSR